MKKYHMVLPFVLGIIENEKGQILIGRHPNQPKKPYPCRWDLPGGKFEPKESVLECLKREIKEETGFDILDAELFDVYHHNENKFEKDYQGTLPGLAICYVLVFKGKFKPQEMNEMHFASKNEINELVFTPWAKYFLERYFDVKA